jgi:hypothetical protein
VSLLIAECRLTPLEVATERLLEVALNAADECVAPISASANALTMSADATPEGGRSPMRGSCWRRHTMASVGHVLYGCSTSVLRSMTNSQSSR